MIEVIALLLLVFVSASGSDSVAPPPPPQEARCLALGCLPANTTLIKMDAAAMIVPVFMPETMTRQELTAIAQRVLPAFKTSVVFIGVGPMISVQTAASVLNAHKCAAVIATGRDSAEHAAAAGLVALADRRYVTLDGKKAKTSCEIQKIPILYVDRQEISRMSLWIMPLAISGHWTELRRC